MHDLNKIFLAVADALNIEATSIIEKDYYVVELLRLLQPLKFETHDLVFAGGTALAKANIQLNRMSEDVDIKIVPKPNVELSRSKAKSIRKQLNQQLQEIIAQSEFFTVEDKTVRDEYRYIELLIRYPQQFNQAPCLRPFIKLEMMEADLLEAPEPRPITSLVYDLTKIGEPIEAFPSATITSTSVEKLIAILRRTAAVTRNAERADDESLVRHIYDYFKITHDKPQDFVYLANLASRVIEDDIHRYGRQHPQMVENPINELLFGLAELYSNPLYQERFQEYVLPMVFGEELVTWDEIYAHFEDSVHRVFKELNLPEKKVVI